MKPRPQNDDARGKEIGAFEAKTRFGELLSEVEDHGQSFLITRRGVAIARLVPVRRAHEDSGALLDAFRKFRAAHPMDGIGARELIDEGRKR